MFASFSKALFCYDELLLLNPKNFHYMTKIAEVKNLDYFNILFYNPFCRFTIP